MDGNGDDELSFEAVDSDGNRIPLDAGPDTFVRYSQDDTFGVDTEDDHKHGRVHSLRGPAPELWIYCYNQAGKETRKKLPAQQKAKKERADVLGLERNIPTKPSEEPRELTSEVADKLIFWYGRLGHPNQKTMRRLVATKLPPSAGITVEDVDLMLWVINGTMLNTKKLHEIVVELKVTDKGSYRPRGGSDTDNSDDDQI